MAETSGSNNKTKGKKRARTERDAGDEPGKRARTEPVSEKNPVASTSGATTPAPNVQKPSEPKKAVKREQRIVKLVPPRPFPTVAAGANATGPRSALSEGKNMICITRRTELGAYLRRCKELVLQDGYRTLHLHAMGAAIPHLMFLATSLPLVLPHPEDEIITEIKTGTVQCVDEVMPAEEDEEEVEGGVQVRSKSTLEITIKIGDGQKQGDTRAQKKKPKQGKKAKPPGAEKKKTAGSEGVRDAPSDEEIVL